MNSPHPPIDFTTRLKALREELRKQKLDGFLAPVADEYQSEALPPSAQRVAFLTGFTGSAGLAALTSDRLLGKAAFFTDGRYTLQANQQLPEGLYEIFDSVQKAPSDWLKENARPGFQIGFDPLLHTADSIERLQKALDRTGIDVVPVKANPIDAFWPDRPAPPFAPVYAYDTRYAGQSSDDKRRQIAETLKKDGIQAALITDSASIAWILNVRGGDLPYSPLPLSVAILRADASLEWFIDPRKITTGLEGFLGADVTRYNMDDLPSALRRLGETRSRVRADPSEVSYWMMKALGKSGAKIDRGEDPCALPKACKNAAELEGMRAAHRRDGAALANFLCWLDANADSGSVTELSAEEKLLECRAAMPMFKGLSFATIAGSGSNGAIVHYRATPESNRTLDPNSLFLIDSGGQYLDGTTDVTRTVAIGTPTAEMRDRFTRVLKGHIALAAIVFPEGTTGAELEVLARQYLWSAGLDYSHSTGHGVGSYLNVHEGPQGISRRGQTPIKPGMVLSYEPGYYKPKHYGIRIENVQAVVERIELNTPEHKMLGFEPLTLAPIDRRLIDTVLLLPAEREWLNAYHARVRQAIRPLVSNGTVGWLERVTEVL
jgi:Xaa-Pro aminopeptidase